MAVHRVARHGHLEDVTALLDEHPSLLEDRHGYAHWTPLMTAARAGQCSTVVVLLSRGAEIDAVDRDGYTALHLAAIYGQAEVVFILMEHGSGDDGRALIEATAGGHLSVVERIIVHSGGEVGAGAQTALWCACDRGHREIIRALLLGGADPDARDEWGVTPRETARNYDSYFDDYYCMAVIDGEMDRLYTIHRARCVCHDYSSHRDFATIAPLDVYHVRGRAASGVKPPRVRSVSSHRHAGHRRSRSMGNTKPRGRGRGRGKAKKDERSAVIDFVVRDLPPELYAELMAGLSLC